MYQSNSRFRCAQRHFDPRDPECPPANTPAVAEVEPGVYFIIDPDGDPIADKRCDAGPYSVKQDADLALHLYDMILEDDYAAYQESRI